MMASQPRKSLMMVCTVWGMDFNSFFTTYSLPSLLAKSNIPELASSYAITFLLYTDRKDLLWMEEQPSFQALMKLVLIRPVFFDTLPPEAAKGHWLQWQHAALNYSSDVSGMMLIIPDCIYASDSLSRIAAALETSDFVYYSLPQVCEELIRPELDALLSDMPSSATMPTLAIAEHKMLDMLVKYLNPKHAVAVTRPIWNVLHPEYLFDLSGSSLQLAEPACHPLAISGNAIGFSETWNPLVNNSSAAFLEVLGLSCEFTLKYVEQYFHWPSLHYYLSRPINLSSWAYTFQQPGSREYSGTVSQITLKDGGEASQSQSKSTFPRMEVAAYLLKLGEMVYSTYLTAAYDAGGELVRHLTCLALSAAPIRRHLRRAKLPLTVLLPVESTGLQEVLDLIEQSGDFESMVELIEMHMFTNHLELRAGQAFVLNSPYHGRLGGTRFQIVHAALTMINAGDAVGKVLSGPVEIQEGVFVYRIKAEYLDPNVLQHKLSRYSRSAVGIMPTTDTLASSRLNS